MNTSTRQLMREWKGTVKNMKTWYCVTSSFNDKGRATAAITATKEAEECPECKFKITSCNYFFIVWFGCAVEAEYWV